MDVEYCPESVSSSTEELELTPTSEDSDELELVEDENDLDEYGPDEKWISVNRGFFKELYHTLADQVLALPGTVGKPSKYTFENFCFFLEEGFRRQ